MRTKKALLFLTVASGVLFSSCWGSGNWWKWITAASQVAFNVTGTLDNVGVLTG